MDIERSKNDNLNDLNMIKNQSGDTLSYVHKDDIESDNQ